MLEVSGLEARYGRIPALHGIDLRVDPGELVALIGANGAGKSTLLRALSGIQAASGRILFQKQDIEKAAPEQRVALGLVHAPEGRQVFGPLGVEDNLRLGAYRRGRRTRARSLERVYALFPALAERRRHAAGTLSGGQQQMLAIARALLNDNRLLLIDEPTKGLAPFLVTQVADVLERASEFATILLVEQNLGVVRRIAQDAVVLDQGRVVHCGDARALLADPAQVRRFLGVAG
jgi:branched-chain amino acid transport system ATP-binding protein